MKSASLHIKGVTYICKYTFGNVRISKEHKSFKWLKMKYIQNINFIPSYGTKKLNCSMLNRQIAEAVPASALVKPI